MSTHPLGGVIDRTSPVPLHDQLRRLLLETIEGENLHAGDPLPGELRLCEQYGISRTVVRQALAQLENEGLIERLKGRGTFVAPPKTGEHLAHTLLGLYEDVERRGGHVRSDVFRFETIPADASVAEALDLAPGDPVVVLERRRNVDGHPWSLSTTWMPEWVGTQIMDVDLTEQSLYRVLRDRGITATGARRSAEATVATTVEAELLGVAPGLPLLRLRSVNHDADGRAIELFIALHRGDRSRFEFDVGSDAHAAVLHLA